MYIDGNQVDLGVTVLARLGGGHVDDLARATCGTGPITAASSETRKLVIESVLRGIYAPLMTT